MSGRIVHFELPYDDGDRARSFYSSLFGWDLQSYPGEGEGDYTLVTTGPTGEQGATEPGFINGGMGPRGQSFSAPTVVIDVESIDETLSKIEAAGGTVVSGKTAVGPMGWAAYFTDTEGNQVGLWENAPQQG